MCLHVRKDMNKAAAFCLSVKVVRLHAVTAYRGAELSHHSFLTSGLAVQLHALAALTPDVMPRGTHGVGSWVGCRACMDILEKKAPLPGIELRLSVV